MIAICFATGVHPRRLTIAPAGGGCNALGSAFIPTNTLVQIPTSCQIQP
jgi:hypothetical protein